MSEMPERVWVARHSKWGQQDECSVDPSDEHLVGDGMLPPVCYIRADRYDELRRLAEAAADCCDFPATCDASNALRAFLDSNGGTDGK